MEDEKTPLSRRVPGAARAAPAASARPVLPPAVLERMRAAIDAERGEAREPSPSAMSAPESGAAGAPAGVPEPITEPMPRIQASASGSQARASAPAASKAVPQQDRTPTRRSRGKRDRRQTPSRTVPPPDTTFEHQPTALEVSLPAQAMSPESTVQGVKPGELNGAAAASTLEMLPATQTQPAATSGAEAKPEAPPLADTAPLADLVPRPEPPPRVEPTVPSRSDARPEHAADPKPELHRGRAAPTGFKAALDGVTRTSPNGRAQAAARAPDKERPPSAPTRVRPGPPTTHTGRQPAGLRRLGTGRLVAAAVVVIAAASVAIPLSLGGTSTNSSPRHLTPAQRAVLVTRQAAATWVAHEVSDSTPVACDPAMCAAIENAGFPQGDLTVLRPQSGAPLSSDLVAETAYVRTLLGTSFSTRDAPTIIAAFGKGAASIQIRAIAQGGAAAYRNQLTEDTAASKAFGAVLLDQQGFQEITVLPIAKTQMASGAVDMRVLDAIFLLAAKNPIEIIDFGNAAAGASQGVPLRYVDLAINGKAARMTTDAYRMWMLKTLATATYRPLWTKTLQLRDGTVELRIGFGAPTPPGLKQP
jgi:hypothetical protein